GARNVGSVAGKPTRHRAFAVDPRGKRAEAAPARAARNPPSISRIAARDAPNRAHSSGARYRPPTAGAQAPPRDNRPWTGTDSIRSAARFSRAATQGEGGATPPGRDPGRLPRPGVATV